MWSLKGLGHKIRFWINSYGLIGLGWERVRQIVIIFLTVPSILYWIIKINCLAPKAFEFGEIFSKPVWLPLADFQKLWALCCQKWIVHLQPICRISKLARLTLPVSKALGATLRNLSSNRSNGFEFVCIEKLSTN